MSEIDTLRDLLDEVVNEYADHDAWRCGHPKRYDLGYDCECGLHQMRRRVTRALGRTPCEPCGGSGFVPLPADRDDDGWTMCTACKATGVAPEN